MDMNHILASSVRDSLPFSGAESFFPGWKQCLGQARLSAELQVSYRRGIEVLFGLLPTEPAGCDGGNGAPFRG